MHYENDAPSLFLMGESVFLGGCSSRGILPWKRHRAAVTEQGLVLICNTTCSTARFKKSCTKANESVDS